MKKAFLNQDLGMILSMTKFLGIAEGSHDASWCLIEDGNIIEAHHAERFSRTKNDKVINKRLLPQADLIISHENKQRVEERRKFAGQGIQKKSISEYNLYNNHHDSHAWAGWATAPFDDCAILVIDAIGEWECSVYYLADKNGPIKESKKVIHSYPNSMGLAYSAITAGLGYKPMEEEYIVMGLAAYGEPTIDFTCYPYNDLIKQNCHKGIHLKANQRPEDIAASIQLWYEEKLLELVNRFCGTTYKGNLIIMGGCALNCVANTRIAKIFPNLNIWIMPNPGDAGSSLGAAAWAYGKKINWKNPYLGTNIGRHVHPDIGPEHFSPRIIAKHLEKHGVCGVAHGRAEFGPRALGNRSLLADPRRDIKETVDTIKKRQPWRPYAPAILEEYADEYFEGPMNEYMQYTAQAKHDYKAVTHVDGSARVQVVKKDCGSEIRNILEEWYNLTGCPMLLNTSLNIKGMPIVNDWKNAREFEKLYKVKVF